MTCKVCGDPIPDARLEAQPRTVTCSRACSEAHTRNLRAASSARWHKRQREAHRERHQEGE